MKKNISLILAALLLASSAVSCGRNPDSVAETSVTESSVAETNGETVLTETVTPETPAPELTYATDKVTVDGTAAAHIVLSENGDDLLTYAAEELVYHIKKVSGADISVVNTPADDSLPIIIGTPDSVPELLTLFPEDMEWITTLEEDGKSYGDDGFAVRLYDGKIYLFGATPRGALNAVYDFIEENMDVLWLRADEEKGLIYDEQPTITVKKTDYREKSPFSTRGWHLCGTGPNWEPHTDAETEILMSRNKLNAKFAELNCNEAFWSYYPTIGLSPFNLGHNLIYWVKSSPIYDPECTEYWNTDSYGNPYPTFPDETSDIYKYSQINFWSELTLQTVTASVLNFLANNDTKTISVGVEDNVLCTNAPYSEQPFEYAPGQFVDPSDSAYISTVFFTFLNKIAREVKEQYPDVVINTFAYLLVENPPLCELEDNITLVIAPILEDMSSPITDPENHNNIPVHALMEKWKDVPNDIVVYNYYGSSSALKQFERPIWNRMQADFQYYASIGFTGTMPEGVTDQKESASTWDMNTLTFWLYSKLSWNPYEDVDELIKMFCDRYYGEASEEMQEYYSLLEQCWEEGESENYLWNFKLTANYYFDTFIYMIDREDDMIEILNRAYEAADDTVKARILPIKTNYENYFAEE